MGRRKIEIKAIKDDRNRSVTFLKRKGGLFKKAHELSVLCSVDVTVIIFGHNKKLYEFSSGDVRETLGRYQYQCGQAHEHKGPADYAGKGDLNDDDDDDGEMSPPPEDLPPQHQRQNSNAVPPRMPNQPTFQHVNHTASASPPVTNGMAYHPPNGTPQPAPISRPSSRNKFQGMPPGGVAPQTHPHHSTPPPPPPPQNSYPYMQNPQLYNPQVNPNLPQHQQAPPPPPPPPPHHQHQQHQQHQQQQHFPYARQGGSQPPPPQPPMGQPPPPQQNIPVHPHQPPQQHAPPPQPHPHSQAVHDSQEQQRRQSIPAGFPPPHEQQQQQQASQPGQQGQKQEQSQSQEQSQVKSERPQSPPPPKPLPTKSRSIFTPIDDHRSVLAQHFGFGPTAESPKAETPLKTEGPGDTESSSVTSFPPISAPSLPNHATRSLPNPHRAQSLTSVPDVPGISRTSSLQSGPKRPTLQLQIPSENSDAGSASADSSPKGAKNPTLTPAKEGGPSVVLPPPSPSASALLSAGASGPPNPFARPPLPTSAAPNTSGDTPISALPSRFVSDALLPSPSVFYSEWSFGRSGPDSNMLPSPLTFPTPIGQTESSQSKETEETEKKRKSPDNGTNTSEGNGGGTAKRLKAD